MIFMKLISIGIMAVENPSRLTDKAKPFLKWVGGKQQLLSQFEAYFPKQFDRYVEPFIGGGAVFFHLWNTQRLAAKNFLFDHNEELINAYCIVRDQLDKLIEVLETHQKNHSKGYFYEIRQLDRTEQAMNDIERAARLIYLNKTCYNGLYRINSKKQFNSPIGRYKNPKIFNKTTLQSTSFALQNVSIEVMDFRKIICCAQKRDFFYFDPPYDPMSKTANFTGYTAHSFQRQDQKDLAELFTELTEKGCFCMLSNSDTAFIQELYHGFHIHIVHAKRSINSAGNKRGDIREIVVTNY